MRESEHAPRIRVPEITIEENPNPEYPSSVSNHNAIYTQRAVTHVLRVREDTDLHQPKDGLNCSDEFDREKAGLITNGL